MNRFFTILILVAVFVVDVALSFAATILAGIGGGVSSVKDMWIVGAIFTMVNLFCAVRAGYLLIQGERDRAVIALLVALPVAFFVTVLAIIVGTLFFNDAGR